MDYLKDLHEYYQSIKLKMWKNNDSKNLIVKIATVGTLATSGAFTLCPVKFFRRNIKTLAKATGFGVGVIWTLCDLYAIIRRCDRNGLNLVGTSKYFWTSLGSYTIFFVISRTHFRCLMKIAKFYSKRKIMKFKINSS